MAEGRKIFWKHWSGVLVLVVLAGAVILLLINLEEVISAVQDKLSAYRDQKQLEDLEKPYKNDKYGGATPEETFDLFIAALKKEDIDLASKYFVIPKQESWRKTLEQYKSLNFLANFYSELEISKKKWELVKNNNPEVTEYSYFTVLEENGSIEYNGQNFPLEKGKYRNTARFEKYPSGVWKISVI